MKLETFFEKFDQFADAPDSVARMRELVLRLATAGLLTNQKTSDGSGRGLLSQINQVREELIDDGTIRQKVADRPETAGDTIKLPPSWARTTISEICYLLTGATPSRQVPQYFGGDIRWLVSGDINQGQITECEGRITEEGLASSNCKIIPAQSVMIALNGQGKTRATVAMLRVPATCNQSLVAMVPYSHELLVPEYIFWNLRGRYTAIRDITGQKQRRGLNMGLVGSLSIPLPPLAEQKRIVAKVDELMALCDRLEAQQQERDTRRATLARASLARFADAPTPANLNFLFHKSYDTSPADLRKSILTLAVQGKLVPQDPNDEPAGVLMEKIAEAIKGQVNAGSVRAMKPLTTVTDNEKTFPLPAGWAWARLQEVIDVRDGTHDSPKDSTDPDAFPLVTSRNFENGDINFETTRRISAKDHFEIQKRSKVEKHDILFSMIGGNIGNQVIVKTDAQFSVKNVALFKYYDRSLTYPLFIKRYMEHLAIRLQQESVGGAQPFVSLGYFRKLPIALPPTTEQLRIVAKVDQLMALVDELENHLAASHATANKLLEALVAELTVAGAPSRRGDV